MSVGREGGEERGCRQADLLLLLLLLLLLILQAVQRHLVVRQMLLLPLQPRSHPCQWWVTRWLH